MDLVIYSLHNGAHSQKDFWCLMTVAGAEGEEGGQLDTVWPAAQFPLSPVELWQPRHSWWLGLDLHFF